MVPASLAIDVKSIYDSMYGASGPLELTEKRTAIEMVGVQQSLVAEHVKLHWVNGDANLSDALTKEGAETVFHDFLERRQVWTLVHDPLMQSAKKRKSARVDRLGTAHSAQTAQDFLKPWVYEWPEPPPTLAQDAHECCDDAEPFGYLDSVQLRSLLSQYLRERASDSKVFVTYSFDRGDLPNE